MKRSRRKNLHPAISFFAFQDIITALAGAMLITVLLTMYEKNRTAAETVSDAPQTVSAGQYGSLQQKIALTRSELQRKKNDLETLRQSFRADAAREAELRRNREISAMLPDMQKILAQRQKRLHQLQKRAAELKSQLRKYPEETLTQAANAQKHHQQLQHDSATFKLQSATGKKVLLLELARDRWHFKTGAQKSVLHQPDALRQISEKLKEYPAGSVHLIIAVRPSAGYFAEALKQRLHSRFPTLEITSEPLTTENTGELVL